MKPADHAILTVIRGREGRTTVLTGKSAEGRTVWEHFGTQAMTTLGRLKRTRVRVVERVL